MNITTHKYCGFHAEVLNIWQLIIVMSDSDWSSYYKNTTADVSILNHTCKHCINSSKTESFLILIRAISYIITGFKLYVALDILSLMTFNLFQDKKLKYFDHTHTSQSNEARIRVPFAPKPRKFYTLKRRSAFPSELNILLNLEEISQLLLSETSETCMCKNMNIKLLPRIINPE